MAEEYLDTLYQIIKISLDKNKECLDEGCYVLGNIILYDLALERGIPCTFVKVNNLPCPEYKTKVYDTSPQQKCPEIPPVLYHVIDKCIAANSTSYYWCNLDDTYYITEQAYKESIRISLLNLYKKYIDITLTEYIRMMPTFAHRLFELNQISSLIDHDYNSFCITKYSVQDTKNIIPLRPATHAEVATLYPQYRHILSNTFYTICPYIVLQPHNSTLHLTLPLKYTNNGVKPLIDAPTLRQWLNNITTHFCKLCGIPSHAEFCCEKHSIEYATWDLQAISKLGYNLDNYPIFLR
jgi:hypothetical protein